MASLAPCVTIRPAGWAPGRQLRHAPGAQATGPGPGWPSSSANSGWAAFPSTESEVGVWGLGGWSYMASRIACVDMYIYNIYIW